jgi:outer membrane protein TolC
VTAGKLEAAWWTLFNDDILSDLQIRAQKGNLDLQPAASRIAQSRAMVGVANAAGLPSVGLSGGYAREALSVNGTRAQLGAKYLHRSFLTFFVPIQRMETRSLCATRC